MMTLTYIVNYTHKTSLNNQGFCVNTAVPTVTVNTETFKSQLISTTVTVLNYRYLGQREVEKVNFTEITGCKENHFYSLPFGQVESRIY